MILKELIKIGNNIISGKDNGNMTIKMEGYGILTK
jgi:hypothetical protein